MSSQVFWVFFLRSANQRTSIYCPLKSKSQNENNKSNDNIMIYALHNARSFDWLALRDIAKVT